MAEAKHTPGPWRIEQSPFFANIRAEAAGVSGIASIQLVSPSTAEALANACLIAAAPDMRAALEAQESAEKAQANCPDCEGIGDWAECGRCSELFGTAIDLRRAALAKAEGL